MFSSLWTGTSSASSSAASSVRARLRFDEQSVKRCAAGSTSSCWRSPPTQGQTTSRKYGRGYGGGAGRCGSGGTNSGRGGRWRGHGDGQRQEGAGSSSSSSSGKSKGSSFRASPGGGSSGPSRLIFAVDCDVGGVLESDRVGTGATDGQLRAGLLRSCKRFLPPERAMRASTTYPRTYFVGDVGWPDRPSLVPPSSSCARHPYIAGGQKELHQRHRTSASRCFSTGEAESMKAEQPAPLLDPEKLGQDFGVSVTRAQLRRVFIASAIPFVGFGFLDNFIMILMGDAIDASLCVKFGFSTMTAAALGNTFSDICGVFSGGAIEDFAQKNLGIEMPTLDTEQMRLAAVKYYQYSGQAVGIVIGCLLGMCPLLWMDPDATERLKKEKIRSDVFMAAGPEMLNRIVTDVNDLLSAEATFIMMIDKEKEEMYTVATENIPEFRSNLRDGVMGHAATTKKFVNLKDVRQSEFFDAKRHINYRDTGRNIKSVLCMPVLALAEEGEENDVVAVVESVNKKADTGFTKRQSQRWLTYKDEEVLAAICSHITTALADDEHRKFKNVIDMCRRQIVDREQYTTMNPVIEARQMKLFETLMQETSSILKAEASHLLLIDPVRHKIRTKVGHQLPLAEFELDEDIMGKVCQRGQLVNSTDFQRSKYYVAEKHANYLNSGIEVRTRLCVPVINTERHVIGCLEVINKKSNEAFNTEDIEQLLNIAGHVALTLEGQGSSIKKVLALASDQRVIMQESKDFKRTATRQQAGPLMLQPENHDHDPEDAWDDELVATSEDAAAMAGLHGSHGHVGHHGHLKTPSRLGGGGRGLQGEHLHGAIPIKASPGGATLQGGPPPPSGAGAVGVAASGGRRSASLAARQKLAQLQAENDLVVFLEKASDLPKADLFGTIDPYITVAIVEGDPCAPNYDGPTKGRGCTSPLGSGKSSPIRQNQNPRWNETIHVDLPPEMVDSYENLYIHVKLWDWDFMKSDDMIGEMVYPLKRVLQEDTMACTSFTLSEIRNNPDRYDLKKSRIWLKFAIGKKKPEKQEVK